MSPATCFLALTILAYPPSPDTPTLLHAVASAHVKGKITIRLNSYTPIGTCDGTTVCAASVEPSKLKIGDNKLSVKLDSESCDVALDQYLVWP